MAGPITLSKRGLSELLGEDFKVSWIEEKCRTRQIPHLLIAGRYHFTEAHVAEILAMHERRPAPADSAEAAPAPSAPAPRRRSRAPHMAPPDLTGRAPLKERGLPVHRLQRTAS